MAVTTMDIEDRGVIRAERDQDALVERPLQVRAEEGEDGVGAELGVADPFEGGEGGEGGEGCAEYACERSQG